MAESSKEPNYDIEQSAALSDLEVLLRDWDKQPVTEEIWKVLAERSYRPALEPAEFRGAKDTETVFKKGGDWKAQRLPLHRKLIRKVLDRKPAKQRPTLVLLGGGAASGKSSLRKLAIEDYPEAIVIDPDEFKFALPEFEAFRKSDPLRAAARVHEESSYLAQAALESAFLQRTDVILDAVSGNPVKLRALIKRFQENGFSVDIRFVDAPVSEALRRMATRAKASGRWVPPLVLERGHYGAAASYFHVKDLANKAQFWDNSNGTPNKVAETAAGSPDRVYNIKKYEAYQRKSRHG